MAKAVIVFHSAYGCETGCCGHRVLLLDPAPEEWPEDYFDLELDPASNGDRYLQADCRQYDFGHPEVADREAAEDIVRRTLGPEHVKDLDWDHCIVVDWEHCSW